MAKISGNKIHVVSVRMVAVGSGALQTRLISKDNLRSQTLSDTTLLTDNDKEPTRIANFQSQKIQIEIRLRNENEYLDFNKFIAFIKPVATGYPQSQQ
jgi:hypothetical protein